VNGVAFEAAVKGATSREGMREPVPKPRRTVKTLPWDEKASDEAGKTGCAEGNDG
jgi:hypothetical protein